MESWLTANARKILTDRYLRKDAEGRHETIEAWLARICAGVARACPSDEARTAGTLCARRLLESGRAILNTPALMSAGLARGQLAACFVLPIADDMGVDGAGIFATLRNAALIQQTGGGIGFDWSSLRPYGDHVESSHGDASGPISFMKVYDIAFNAISRGGCLVADTLVNTASGLLRMDELVDITAAGWIERDARDPVTVATDEGARAIVRKFNNGVAPILRITTENGTVIRGTRNHRVKVMTETGPQWSEFGELHEGDYIMFALNQHQGTPQILEMPDTDGMHFNVKRLHFPRAIDAELAFVLGYMAGNGYVASGDENRVGFSVPHKSYLIEELPHMLGRVFGGCHVTVHQKPDDASILFDITSVLLKQYLIRNGLSKSKSYDARVPRVIRQSPREIVGMYLRGFFEADGSFSEGYPSFTTTSRQLVVEISALLMGLGCPSAMHESKSHDRFGTRPVYKVRIRGYNGLIAWSENIGCDPRSRFIACIPTDTYTGANCKDILPYPQWWIGAVSDAIDRMPRTKENRPHLAKLTKTVRRYLSGQHQLTAYMHRSMRAEYAEFAELARPIGNMWFAPITSIIEETEPQLTLDIEVDDNHTYIANGMVVHNSRRCANMGVMRVDHPDIEQFIECKSHSETVLTSFNISIALTDEFMRAVANDAQFSLINPHGGKVARTVRARELMRKIAQGAWVNGEPGVLFIDTINAENAMSHKYTIVATNPCGEQNLGPYENCCLGHVNLAWHCDPSDGSIDWARMRETVRDLVDVLNMVIDANYYIPAIPQLRERAFAARRIGLGITGLADVFMLNEIAYGSPESVELAERIACFIRLVAMECSVELAQRDGAFPEFEGSSWSREEVRAEFVSRVARACARGIACTSDVALAQHIMEGIAECGIRNASILTVAPTGTTSLILGVEGYGCEPIFSLAYSRTLGDGSRMQFCSELARRVAARYVSGADLETVCEEIRDKGCAPDCAAIPQIARDAIGATALRVAPAQHLAIQAALQRWVDSSISKTVNCPHDTTVEEVEKMYLDAWKLRLKGVAIYRSGSRTSEVLTVPAAAPAAAPAAPTRSSEVHRPPYVCGGTYRCEASFGHVFTTVNTITDESGIAPFEVFIAVGKSGSDIQADSEAIGRLISTILRLNSTVPPVERLGMVIAQLRNIGGSRGHRDSQTKAMIQSLPDAVAFSLSEVMKLWSARDEVASITAHVSRDCDICPECGATALRRVERCKKCSECGYSAC